MRATDWSFDFASLPRWENRERIPFVYDEFFEVPGKDMLCCIYSVAEVSMLDYLGFLAILRNKEKPELVLNVADYPFCVNFSQSEDGRFLFLQPSVYSKETGHIRRPVLILDMEKGRFTFVRTKNYCPIYQVVEKKPNVFVIEADEIQRKGIPALAALHGKVIRTKWKKWYPMEQLNKLPQIVGV